MSSTFNVNHGFLLLCTVFFYGTALGESCDPAPGNEYEKVFCELKRKGKGDALPNIYEFRKNPPVTQAFMLKKPAERAGITIRIPERENQETLSRQDEILLPGDTSKEPENQVKARQEAPKPSVAKPEPQLKTGSTETAKQAAQKKAIPALNSVVAPIDTGLVESCTLKKLILECTGDQYHLVGNKTNQQLDDKVLSDEHTLSLPVYTGSPDDSAALEKYLAEAYERYLDGMIEIGLGGSTMTYTKFVNLYHYIVEQHLDFASRFETMYHFLKKDKTTMGVNTALRLADGFNLQSCSQLDTLVACDYQKTNYVFSKASR